MKSHCRVATGALILAVLMGTMAWGKTKLVQSWADPSAANHRFTKVLALAVIDNMDIRRATEGALVRNMPKVKAYPSNTVLQAGEERDVEAAKRRLREGGFDGAVVIRLVNADDKVQYVAPTMPDPYIHYTTYNAWAWPVTSTPGYMKYDRILQVETLFYSLEADKLLWSGVCESSNPESASNLVDQVAKVIRKELQKKGILK